MTAKGAKPLAKKRGSSNAEKLNLDRYFSIVQQRGSQQLTPSSQLIKNSHQTIQLGKVQTPSSQRQQTLKVKSDKPMQSKRGSKQET